LSQECFDIHRQLSGKKKNFFEAAIRHFTLAKGGAKKTAGIPTGISAV